MLLGMTLTHLPTHFSRYFYQPFGFVGWAEGFVLLSAFLVGRVYGGTGRSWTYTCRRLHRRCAKLYAYHVGILAVAFTAVAVVAVHANKPALLGLLDFYLAHRVLAIMSSIVLLYCPPLMDVLPMYIFFLLFAPLALYAGKEYGWRFVLVLSALVWVGAQLGLREILISASRHVGLEVPGQNLGAFNLLGWQVLWIVGLWLGAGAWEWIGPVMHRQGIVLLSAATTALFLVLRFHLTSALAVHPVEQGSASLLFDKWHLGVLRLIDLAALGILFANLRNWIAKDLAPRPLVLLGKSSLEVFAVHLLFVFGALVLVDDGSGAGLPAEMAIVGSTVLGLFGFVYLKAQWQRFHPA